MISPDNFVKKFGELRTLLFPGLKSRKECQDEDIEYNPEAHLLTEEAINMELLSSMVEKIFRKAQLEKEYTIFYGKLCEKIIDLELTLRDMECKISTMKQS